MYLAIYCQRRGPTFLVQAITVMFKDKIACLLFFFIFFLSFVICNYDFDSTIQVSSMYVCTCPQYRYHQTGAKTKKKPDSKSKLSNTTTIPPGQWIVMTY